MAAWRLGGLAAWRLGDLAIWRFGDLEYSDDAAQIIEDLYGLQEKLDEYLGWFGGEMHHAISAIVALVKSVKQSWDYASVYGAVGVTIYIHVGIGASHWWDFPHGIFDVWFEWKW